MVQHFKEGKTSLLNLLLCIGDVVIVGYGFILAHLAYSDSISVLHDYAGILAAALFLIFANVLGFYGTTSRYARQSNDFGKIMVVWLLVLGCSLLFAYATKTSSTFSRMAVAEWMISVPFILYIERRLMIWVQARVNSGQKVVPVAIAGSGALAYSFLNAIRDEPTLGMRVAGIYTLSTDTEDRSFLLPEDKVLVCGDIRQLVIDAKKGNYSELYIAISMRYEVEIGNLLAELSDCPIPVYYVPDFFAASLMSFQVYRLRGMPIIGVYEAPLSRWDVLLKRVEDVVLGILILCVTALPMLVITVAIKLTSEGPVLFRQKRYGLGGESIEVWKFRSMTVCDNGDVVVQAKKNDRRVTRIGSFLRRTSLDELPQFLNVLRGEMSIVGPRPHAIAHNELYRKKIMGYMLRHLVKPGITGWAQINGWRGETDTLEKMEKRVQYDLEYIKNWSLWLDFKIIALTIVKGFSGKNVY